MLSKTGKPDEAKVLYRAEAVQAEKSNAEKQKRRRTQK